MLAFVDESGDAGVGPDASPYLVVAVVMFADHAEAGRCGRAIEDLAREIGRGPQEFRFSKDSHATRRRFLEAVTPFGYTFHAVVLDKRDPKRGEGNAAGSLYARVCGAALAGASGGWSDALVVLDALGARRFQKNLTRTLKQEAPALRGPGAIGKMRMSPSHSERLLQLADYVAGIVNRRQSGKKLGNRYFAAVRGRGTVRRWPQ